MIMNMNEKGRQTKLLAAIAVLAMVVCALAVVLPADEANAADPVEPTAIKDYKGLEAALTSESDGVYELTADITGSYSSAITVTKNITIDLNGYDVSITAKVDATFVKISSANADAASLTITSSNDATEKDVFSVTGSSLSTTRAIFSIEQNGSMAVDNVNIVSNASPLFPNGQASTLTVTDSRIDGGAYCIGTNNADSKGNTVNISVTNSVLDSGYGIKNGDDCTVIVNIPNVTLNISESDLSGDRQVLFVRCGTATVSNSTINFTATFQNDPYYPTTDAAWKSGNEATTAAVVVGDYGNDSAYRGNAILNLNGCTINAGAGVPVFVSSDKDTKATYNESNTTGSGEIEIVISQPSDMESAMKNNSVDSIVYTGTEPIKTTITKELTVTNASALSGAQVGPNGSVAFVSDGTNAITTSEAVSFKDGSTEAGTVKLESVVADSVEFYYGSAGVHIEGASAGSITVTGDGKVYGTIEGTVTITSGSPTTVTVDKQGLTFLGTNPKLIVDTNITLKAGSNLKVDKDATGASVEVKGTFEYTTVPDTLTVTNNGGVIKVEGGQGTENIISVSQDVNGTYYLTADTTILSGVTLTVPRNAVLNLMGHDLIVEGTLVVENRGTVTSGVGDVTNATAGNIVLTTTGSIQNEGTIGDKMSIDVANKENLDQVVSMKGVSGVNFELIRSIVGTDRVYDMAVSGDISAVKGVTGAELELKNVDINGNMTVDDNIDFIIAAGTTEVTGNGTVFTFNGDKMTVTGTFILTNGTSAVLNSEVVGIIYAQTGHMGDDGKLVADETGTPAVPVTYVEFEAAGSGENAVAVGMTISVSKVTVVEEDKSVIYQRMFVSGDIDAAIAVANPNDKEVKGIASVNFAGNVYINESLTFTKDVTVNKAGYTLMVSAGGVVEVVSAADPEVVYNGAKYVIEAEKSSDPDTYYYTTFDAAMQNIVTADGIVTVNGDFTINGTYTVADNQEINVEADSLADKVKVGEGAVITVEVGGYIDNLAIYQILGKVVVLEGDGYEPEAIYPGSNPQQYIYAVMTEDTETLDVTYSGLKTAMDEATAGQTIEVVGSADYDGDLVIPNGVTLKVNEGLTLTVTGDVTVENGGKLILDASTLAVGDVDDNGTGSENVITVAGELDASEAVGITAVTGAKSVNIYSTGKITSATVVGGGVVKMNAAYYNDGEFVYTSLANAVAYAEENALPTGVNVTGTFTETGAVESDGVSIVVDNGANVTFGDITLNNAKISSAAATAGAKQGTYTATITALNGAGDAAADATVAVSKTTATVESKVTLNAEGTSQYALQINGLANANIQAGTVTYVGGSFTVDKENGLTVSSGATLLIGENATLKNADAVMVNNGTIEVAEKKTLTVEGTLAGNVNVPKDATIKSVAVGMTITGTVTVDAQGTFQADGKLQMGAAPELLTDTAAGAIVGKLTLTDNEAYIVAFAGADLSQADIVLNGDVAAELKNTAYQINGIDFVTVYTFGSIDIDGTTGTAVYDAVKGLKDLNTDAEAGTYDIVWYAGETKITNEKVGEYAQVSTEIRYRTVEVTVSEGPAITVSIDGVVWNGKNPVDLTIGTHTVSAVVDPGYTGTIQITFNGVAVTNGQFEITSDMMDSIEDIVLSASGNITQDSTVVVDGGDNGSGEMGLTDYLLIILVILIVVMAIMVAMRLMRS